MMFLVRRIEMKFVRCSMNRKQRSDQNPTHCARFNKASEHDRVFFGR